MTTRSSASQSAKVGRSPTVRPLPIRQDDAAIVAGLRQSEAWARAAFFERYAPAVERIVRKVLGHSKHDEIAEMIHETFLQALASLNRLREPSALLAWMQTIATHTARKAIRARRARRWLVFWAPADVPDMSIDGVAPEVAEAYRKTYALLDRLPADERVAFVLRYVEGLEVYRVAELCDVSLATMKRRLERAEKRFATAARADSILREWLEDGGRWTT
jgi:RNA polymerase sigma-70 factor, ECF subfamily